MSSEQAAQRTWRDWFFWKRLPWREKYRIRSPKWVKPNPEAYQEAIRRDNFALADELPPTLTESQLAKDITRANEELLDVYFQADHEARYHQNRFFRYQWLLVIATFLTASVAVVGISTNPVANTEIVGTEILAEATSEPDAAAVPAQEAAVPQAAGGLSLVVIFTFVGIIASAVSTIFTQLNQRNNPQAKWYGCRTRAEAIRRHYFCYLTHQNPYHNDDCNDILHDQASRIASKGLEVGSTSTTARSSYSADEIKALFDIYKHKRYEFQKSYYVSNQEEYEHNLNFVFNASVTLGVLGTILPTIFLLLGLQQLALVLALLPILITLLSSFEKAYGWKRQLTLYKDAETRLIGSNEYTPNFGEDPTEKHLHEFVKAVEETLSHEMSQWGQIDSEAQAEPTSAG